MIELPTLFALRRYRPDITDLFPELEIYKNLSVLISTIKKPDGSWDLDIIEGPEDYLVGSTIVASYDDKWFNKRVETVTVGDNMQIRFMFNNCIIIGPLGIIPFLKMSDPCSTLSNEFYYLIKDWCKNYRFECVPVNTTRPSDIIKINKKIEDVLADGGTCPVSMLELNTENIRLTMCGHAFSSEIEVWIDKKGTCPVCRQNVDLSGLYSYTC